MPEYFENVWNKPHSGFVKEVDCVVRFRLSEFLQNNFEGQALDTWWDLDKIVQ